MVRKSTSKPTIVNQRPLSEEKSNDHQSPHNSFDACSLINSHSSSSLDECAESGHRTRSNSTTSSLFSMNSTSVVYARRKACHHGLECFKADCEFEHPTGWNPCLDGVRCQNYQCTAVHPSKRKGICGDGDRCKRSECRLLHPKTRISECRWRGKCIKWDCPRLHPSSRPRPCSDKENCTNLICSCLHPIERQKLLCPLGADCRDAFCQLNHPSERARKCSQGDLCSNVKCTYLHSSQWNPDEIENAFEKKKCGKSLEQRKEERTKAQLPIWSYRSEFCRRLEDEHILVVTAETGSGKSTQLPQYAAEHFGSLVVCTQPRVVAALSLAHRVADEYDGTSIGQSVGYKIGHGKRVNGSSIMFMTDAALINESQLDRKLKDIRVLIIDEAHERSLNTDIVLGLAKLLLEERPNDFYVVICSATIDPTSFLRFFDRSTSSPLDVKGRVFPVTLTHNPAPSDCSDDKFLENHLIPTLIEHYPKHDGHILVFLQGQNEIEKAMKIFQLTLPSDCRVLPLYGSQSHEEQEKVIQFNERNKRLVVFSTNVAETSLTIPNVRLVIDSGWAKEAHFDLQRRINVIETVRISRSSADQRKGRAGRTSSGHCLRLYNDNELIRTHIQPEILRSSLDLVLLRLIRINLPPKTFPFLDQPNLETIDHSIDLLTRLKCIDDEKITPQGILFTELGLDPRLSAFIFQIYIEFRSLLELTAGIVGILSAPGTIFFLGGSTQHEKDQAKIKLARQAQHHESDLFHLFLVYDAWKNSTTKQTHGKCSSCLKQVKWCICRIQHSNEHGLNNKILQIVHQTTTSIIEIMSKTSSWLIAEDKQMNNPLEIISRYLSELFPEQCGYFLVPQLPNEGVCLISSDIRAKISNTSAFMQKLHTDSNDQLYQHFIAMNITQLSSGMFIIEKLHPIPRTIPTLQSPVQRLIIIENISSHVFYLMRRKLNDRRGESWAKWNVYEYDRKNCSFILWGLQADKSTIEPILRSIHQEIVKKFSDKYQLLQCGSIKGNFQSGLICTHINRMTKTLRLDLKNMPKVSFNQVKDFLRKLIGIEWDEIKYHGFVRENLYLIFKNENIYRQIRKKIPQFYFNEEQTDRDAEKDTWGREFLLQTPSHITTEDILQRYGLHRITNCIQLNKPKKDKSSESSLKLNNLPITSDETLLRDCLRMFNGPSPSHVYVGRVRNNLSGWAKVTFNNIEQRNRASSIYQSQLCENIFLITIQGKRGPKLKPIRTTLETDEMTRYPSRNLFRLTMINREEAFHLFSLTRHRYPFDSPEWILTSSSRVTIHHTDLYPNCEDILDQICLKYHVKIKCRHFENHVKCYTFSDGTPQQTNFAASMLEQNFAPMNIKLTTDREKYLFDELDQMGLMEKWAKDLSLAIVKNKNQTNIEVRGMQIAQGQLMRRIADYSDDFNQRFRSHQLSSTVAAFFAPQKAALSQLEEINDQWSSKSCSIVFLPKTSNMIIMGKPNVLQEDFNQCEKEVVRFLHELIGTTNDDEDEIVQIGCQCVFCEEKSSISMNLFRICGHGYCQCAAQYLSNSNSFPLRCHQCQTNIHIDDLEIIFSNNDELFLRLLKNSIRDYLEDHVEEDHRVFCPSDQCDGLIQLSRGYHICFTCGHYVCGQCQMIDNIHHLNRTCDQIEQGNKNQDFFTQLFNAAREFVGDHWPVDGQMRPIGRIDENPYLTKRYKSLRVFYEGVKKLGYSLPLDLSKGIFAYHGTSSQSILPICENGFDPKRRSGQVYGRGEYFGITASISHGYSGKGSDTNIRQMIICYLLRCPQMIQKENFCYIVDNPIDGKYSFNLPVLIVTYGSMSHMRSSPFPHLIPDYIDEDERSSSSGPSQWFWSDDYGRYQPYNDQIDRIIERAYEQWKSHGGFSTINIPADCYTQTYQIDFKNNQQMNLRTSFKRSIQRRSRDHPNHLVRIDDQQSMANRPPMGNSTTISFQKSESQYPPDLLNTTEKPNPVKQFFNRFLNLFK